MAAVRSGICVPGRSPRVELAGARDSRLSRYFFLWTLAGPLVGFALAGRVFHLGADGHRHAALRIAHGMNQPNLTLRPSD